MSDIDPRMKEAIEAFVAGAPLARLLGVTLIHADRNSVRFAMAFREDNRTMGDTVHGGAIAALVDIAAAGANICGADPDTLKGGATTSLALNFLSPADGIDVEAEAVVLRRGKSQTVSDISITAPDGRLVAKALATSRVF